MKDLREGGNQTGQAGGNQTGQGGGGPTPPPGFMTTFMDLLVDELAALKDINEKEVVEEAKLGYRKCGSKCLGVYLIYSLMFIVIAALMWILVKKEKKPEANANAMPSDNRRISVDPYNFNFYEEPMRPSRLFTGPFQHPMVQPRHGPRLVLRGYKEKMRERERERLNEKRREEKRRATADQRVATAVAARAAAASRAEAAATVAAASAVREDVNVNASSTWGPSKAVVSASPSPVSTIADEESEEYSTSES